MKTRFKPAKEWRLRAPGSASSLGFFCILLFSCLAFSEPPKSATSKPEKKEKQSELQVYNPYVKKASHYVDQSPFIPGKRDYSLDVGSYWEEQTFFWLGGHVGFYAGKCWLISQEHCQQYIDVLTGVGLRNRDLVQNLALGWRWQFVNYPSSWSFFSRLMAGYAHTIVDDVTRDDFTYGLGLGATRFLHERLDARVEFRVGGTRRLYTQLNFGFQVKVDEWVDFFAKKLRSLGEDTLEATGNILKATGSAVTRPFQSEDDEKEEKKTAE